MSGARCVCSPGQAADGADDNDMDAGFGRWAKALDQLSSDVAVYLENTAGGDHAMARHFDTIARLWDRIGEMGVGFCLDTCHALGGR